MVLYVLFETLNNVLNKINKLINKRIWFEAQNIKFRLRSRNHTYFENILGGTPKILFGKYLNFCFFK